MQGFQYVLFLYVYVLCSHIFLKHREGKLETKNRLFISYLTSIVIMSIVEIIYVLYFLNVGENGPYAKSLYYLYSLSILLATTTSWMFTISYRTALKEEDPTQKKSNRKYKLSTSL